MATSERLGDFDEEKGAKDSEDFWKTSIEGAYVEWTLSGSGPRRSTVKGFREPRWLTTPAASGSGLVTHSPFTP